MDIVRALQIYCMNKNSKGSIVFNTGDINENMGQIEYILADKTGTITENKLRLHTCMIDFYLYETDHGIEHILTQNEENSMIEEKTPATEHVLLQSLQIALSKSAANQIIHNFFICMVVCNTVFPTNSKFLGTSPDEVALIETAENLGIKLLSRSAKFCRVQ